MSVPQRPSDAQNIQWFPGHMTRTKRKIQEQLSLVDAVIEIADARIPISSRNPDLSELLNRKPRLILLNKADMADEDQTDRWIKWYANQGVLAVPADCRTGKNLNTVTAKLKELLAEKTAQWAKKGMTGKRIKVMVVGIPNVGKSSFINHLTRRASAKVEDRPGVTRGNQWFTVDKTLELLDTPGVLWPKFDDKTVGERLAFTGAVKDDVVDTELLAVRLIELLCEIYPRALPERYKLTEETLLLPGYDILGQMARNRGMRISGGEYDTERAATMLLDEFRGGKLGRITLERVK